MQKLSYLVVLLFMVACGRPSGSKIDTRINNPTDSPHVNIPGTRLYIIAPQGFRLSQKFVGLESNDSTIINVVDLPKGNYYSDFADFTKAAMEKKGIKVYEYKTLTVSGYAGKYMSVQGEGGVKGYVLVFGDSSFASMLTGYCPNRDEAGARKIIGALNSIAYDKKMKTDPFATANFSLDDKDSRFKFFQSSANLYVYTPGGVDNSSNHDSAFVIVTQLPKDSSTTEKDIADMMISKEQEYGLTNVEVRNVSQAPVNGYPAYETLIYGKLKGNDAAIYECVVSNGDKAIVIQGVASHDLEGNVPGFLSLAHTVRVK